MTDVNFLVEEVCKEYYRKFDQPRVEKKFFLVSPKESCAFGVILTPTWIINFLNIPFLTITTQTIPDELDIENDWDLVLEKWTKKMSLIKNLRARL